MTRQIELNELFALANTGHLWQDEVFELHEKYGPIDYFFSCLDISKEHYDRWYRVLHVKKNRRGEVALCVRNGGDNILLHTKSFYPQKTYRIPTGGIHINERVLKALYRELDEETGFKPESIHLLALLLYEFRHEKKAVQFVSYLFDVQVAEKNPRPLDESENISGYQWIARDKLPDIINHLKSLKNDRWDEWGLLRAIPHEIIFASDKAA